MRLRVEMTSPLLRILGMNIILLWSIGCCGGLSSTPSPSRPLALVTGATGRTGALVSKLLLDRGFDLRIFSRNTQKAKTTLEPLLQLQQQHIKDAPQIDYCQGQLGNAHDLEQAFQCEEHPISHVVFCAGGDNADYYAVNYRGVADCAHQALATESVKQIVVISAAWSSRPYSIASLLFNSLYDSIPMACHFMGEEHVRLAAAQSGGRLNYVLLRAGGLVSDERLAEQYPETAADPRLTYQQGDMFEFFGKAGRPGMSRTQLAHATATAVGVQGCYTVEVTGSGMVDMDDATIYQGKDILPDDLSKAGKYTDDEILEIHRQAIGELRNTVVATTLSGVALVGLKGPFHGLLSLAALNAVLIFVWSRFYATQQT